LTREWKETKQYHISRVVTKLKSIQQKRGARQCIETGWKNHVVPNALRKRTVVAKKEVHSASKGAKKGTYHIRKEDETILICKTTSY